MKHFILDFETLGQDAVRCPIINCAYFLFDWDRFTSDRPYTFKELVSSIRHIKVSVEDQVKTHGRVVELSSLEFWRSLPEDARKQIKPLPSDVPLDVFVSTIVDYLNGNKVDYWWSRSNTFDPIILMEAARSTNREAELLEKLKYWKVRDTRTFIDAKFNFSLKQNAFVPIQDTDAWKKYFIEHNSVHDVAADILRLQYITRIENE